MADEHVAGLAYIGKPQVAYAATKAAIINFTRVTAVTYAPKNIRLNTVIPGLIHTPLVKNLADRYAGGDYETFVKLRNGQVCFSHGSRAGNNGHLRENRCQWKEWEVVKTLQMQSCFSAPIVQNILLVRNWWWMELLWAARDGRTSSYENHV